MNNDILKRDSERIISNIDFKPLSGLTIFITGSTGLIGTQLLSTLSYLRKNISEVRSFAWFLGQ